MSQKDSYKTYWTVLRGCLDTLLYQAPGTYKPISYEHVYSAVYKCVCRQDSEPLYADLMSFLTTAVSEWAENVGNVGEDEHFLEEFNRVLRHFFVALGCIVPIFTYLNRCYVEKKLQTDINSELLRVFMEIFSDPLVGRALGEYMMQYLQSGTFFKGRLVWDVLKIPYHCGTKSYVDTAKIAGGSFRL